MARNPLTCAAGRSRAFDGGARRPGGPKADAAPRRHPLGRGTLIMTSPGRPRKAQRLRSRTVLATRKPLLLLRFPVEFLLRFAERTFLGLLFHEPPRNTRAD